MQKTQAIDNELLDEWIANSGLKVGFICDQIGVTRQAFAKKRKGKISFRKSEVYVICDLLRLPSDIAAKIFCPNG